MGQRFLFHAAKIGCACGMTGFAPSGTIAQTGVVVHFESGPGRLAGVAGHAGHRTAGKQLRFWYVIGRFSGGRQTVMTAGAIGGYRERAVIGLGTTPGRS